MSDRIEVVSICCGAEIDAVCKGASEGVCTKYGKEVYKTKPK